jgi:preprotein translocase subunit SecF
VKGLNWGLDFTGGYAIEVIYDEAPRLESIRSHLESSGIQHASVITFGSSQDVMIRFADHSRSQEELTKMLTPILGEKARIVNLSYVGPEVGKELAESGFLAMLIAVLATMVYIGLRFESRFAISAALALAHDPIVILGVFSFFNIPFDLTALAAILAVIGYSLNDTVVVYDRVRENFMRMRKASVIEVVNRAINDTLSRTIMTSGLTLTVVVVLFFLGGPSIHAFSLALIIGVIVGTYSSIYIAGSLSVVLGLDRAALIDQKATVGLDE